MLSAINLKASIMSEKNLFEIQEPDPIQSALNISQSEHIEHKLEQESSFDDTSIKTENI